MRVTISSDRGKVERSVKRAMGEERGRPSPPSPPRKQQKHLAREAARSTNQSKQEINASYRANPTLLLLLLLLLLLQLLVDLLGFRSGILLLPFVSF